MSKMIFETNYEPLLRRVSLLVFVFAFQYAIITQFYLKQYLNSSLGTVSQGNELTTNDSDMDEPQIEYPTKLDPFQDIQLSNSTFAYSQHRCVEQPASDFPRYVGRTCLFSNLYFEPSTGQFHYYASPTEAQLEDLSELTVANGYVHVDGLNKPRLLKKIVRDSEYLQFHPVMHFNETAEAQVATLPSGFADPVFLLYKLSYVFNFGHFVFDDILSLFAMLDMFDLTSYQHVPLFLDKHHDPFYRCSPNLRWDVCLKRMKRFSQELLGIQINDRILSVSNFFPNATMVRLPTVVAGAGRLAHYGCQGDCTIHRNVYRARQWAFRNVFGRDETYSKMPVTEPLVTIALPIGNSHEGIEWFENIIPALQKRFQNVKVIDMATITVAEQLLLAAKSAVYLTNHGGGSATSLFLQSGSTVLLFCDPKLRRDEDLYSSLAYLHTEWLLANKTKPEIVVKQVERALDRLGLEY